MEMSEKITWRVVFVTEKILILLKILSFGNLVVSYLMSWFMSFSESPLLSWPPLYYVVSATAYHTFTNPAILTWILGSTHTRRMIHDLGFDYYLQILEKFELVFYCDLSMPLLMRGGCLCWLVALAAFMFSLEKSSNIEKRVKLTMAMREEEGDDTKKEVNGEQFPPAAAAAAAEEEEEKVEDVLESREEETKKKLEEEVAKREEILRKVTRKWKKEKMKRKAYRQRWEKEKEENVRLSGQLSTEGSRWAEFCHTFWENFHGERRRWEEEMKQQAAKLSAAQESGDVYRQLLHDCNLSDF